MRRLLALGVEVGAHPDPAPHPKTSPHLDPNPNPNPDPNPDPNPNLSPNPNPYQVGAVQRLDAELGGPRAVRIMRAGCRQRGATLKHALQKMPPLKARGRQLEEITLKVVDNLEAQGHLPHHLPWPWPWS